jgi:hypothetical protein
MNSNSSSPLNELWIALYNYTASNSDELSFKKGDKIKVLQRDGEWLEGELNGTRGWFPVSFVEPLNELHSPSHQSTPKLSEGVETTAVPKTEVKSTLSAFLVQRGTNKKEFKKKLREKNILAKKDKDKAKDKKVVKSSSQNPNKAQENVYFYSRRPTTESEKLTLPPLNTAGIKLAPVSATTQRKPAMSLTSPRCSPSSLTPTPTSRKMANELEMLKQMQSQKEAKAETERKKNFLSNFLAKRLLRRKTKTSPDSKTDTGICGLSLEQMIQRQKEPTNIPLCIKLCVDFIAQHGLESEGIFRLAGNVTKVEELSRLFLASDLATVGGITPTTDINVVAELLKKILRDLPEPIFTYKFHDEFIKLTDDAVQGRASKFRELFEQLPLLNKEVLKYLFPLLRDVAKHSDKNLMTAENIATIFGPTLLRPKEFDFLKGLNDRSKDVVFIMIRYYEEIFESAGISRREAESGVKTNPSGPPSPRSAMAKTLRVTSPRGGNLRTSSQASLSPRRLHTPPLPPTSPPPPPSPSTSVSIPQTNENFVPSGATTTQTTTETTNELTVSISTTPTVTQ